MPRQNIQNMTPQEMAQYVETVRARNRLNAKKYYNEKIRQIQRSTKNLKLNALKLQLNIIHVQIIDLNKLKIKRY